MFRKNGKILGWHVRGLAYTYDKDKVDSMCNLSLIELSKLNSKMNVKEKTIIMNILEEICFIITKKNSIFIKNT